MSNTAYNREWRKRNPDKIKAYRKHFLETHPGYTTEQVRLWKQRNPDRAKAIDRKASNKRTGNRLIRKHTWFVTNPANRFSQARVAEIMRFHNRGKDVGYIAVAMNITVSSVMAVLNARSNGPGTP